jgi:hypothetical protein
MRAAASAWMASLEDLVQRCDWPASRITSCDSLSKVSHKVPVRGKTATAGK